MVITNTGSAGLIINDTHGNGVSINDAGYYGVVVNDAYYSGMVVRDAGEFGMYIGNAEDAGVYIEDAGTDGVYIGNANGDGVEITGAGGSGVFVTGAGGHGILASTNSGDRYGGYFLNVANSGSGAGVYARGNTDGAPDLELGRSNSESGDDAILTSQRNYASSDLYLKSNDEVMIDLDNDKNESGHLLVRNGDNVNVFEVNETGDVKQPLAADGLVKAAVYVQGDGNETNMIRYFNTVATSITTLTSFEDDACIIDFNFDLRGRFWIATVADYNNYSLSGPVNCYYRIDSGVIVPDQLNCVIEDTSAMPHEGVLAPLQLKRAIVLPLQHQVALCKPAVR
jgi:hypothetical protein